MFVVRAMELPAPTANGELMGPMRRTGPSTRRWTSPRWGRESRIRRSASIRSTACLRCPGVMSAILTHIPWPTRFPATGEPTRRRRESGCLPGASGLRCLGAPGSLEDRQAPLRLVVPIGAVIDSAKPSRSRPSCRIAARRCRRFRPRRRYRHCRSRRHRRCRSAGRCRRYLRQSRR